MRILGLIVFVSLFEVFGQSKKSKPEASPVVVKEQFRNNANHSRIK